MSTSSDAQQLDDATSKNRDAAQQRIRRRNRMITSCLECRRRKLKCDKLQPACSNCLKFSRDCMFLAPALDSVSQKKLNELKERMGSLEKVLEDDIARRTNVRTESSGRRHSSTDLPGEESDSDTDTAEPEDEKRLEVSPLASFDAAYEDGTNEDTPDTGVKIGLFRISERLGGMFRPRFSEELARELGAPIRPDLNDPDVPSLPDHNDFLLPGPTYIAPGAGFLVGDVGPKRNLLNFLPTKAAADLLVQIYHRKCHIVARVVHWPSFQSQYNHFWSQVLSGIEPQPSLQAVVMAIMFSAVVSMENSDIMQLFGSDKTVIQSRFQTGTEVALAKAQVLRTTSIETLQAFIAYLIPLCRDVMSRAHSVLVGAAVRLAECMGLHRDPADHSGTSPVGTHVRRILWFQVCFLDSHTADQQGPRPSIRREDYDTRFPSNVNDTDLMNGKLTEKDSVWTDMTLTRLLFECCEMTRITRVDTERLHQKKISITHVLGKAESFRRAMEAKYHPMLDTTVPIQRYAKYLLAFYTYKLHVMVLNRYHNGVEVRIPDRLLEILLMSAIKQCENGMNIYRDLAFEDLKWFYPGLMRWASALLLTVEVFAHPKRREADRIWAILDFIFKPDTSLTRDMKARQIISAVRDRTAFYRNMRGVRVPVSMQNRLATTLPLREGKDRVQQTAADEPDRTEQHGTVAKVPSQAKMSSAAVQRKSIYSTQTEAISPPESTPEDTSSSASWTFDNPFLTFVDNVPQINAARAKARNMPVSPATSQNSPYSPGSPTPIAPFQNDFLPGVDNGQSPSYSVTNSETWPPPISSGQGGWQYVFSSSPAHSADNNASSQMSYPPNTSDPLAFSGQQHEPSSGSYFVPSSQVNETPYNPAENSVPLNAPVNTTNVSGQTQSGAQDAVMVDINWAEWDKIFPPDINTGNLDVPEYYPA